MAKIIGYARVSTLDQNLYLQLDALKKVGCEKIYTEKISGTFSYRPQFQKVMKSLKQGDMLVVWKLDRLGRSLSNLLRIMEELQQRGIHLKCITDGFDTTTAVGKLMRNIYASMIEYEAENSRERTLAGLEAARLRGRVGGRPKGLTPKAVKQAYLAKKFYQEKDKITVETICKKVGIKSKTTFYKYLRFSGVSLNRKAINT